MDPTRARSHFASLTTTQQGGKYPPTAVSTKGQTNNVVDESKGVPFVLGLGLYCWELKRH